METRFGGRRSVFRWLAPVVLLVAIALAWGDSLSAPFELDDQESILGNESLRDFWSFRWLSPPGSIGETVGGRPFLNLSFALNYAAGGVDVRGYRAVNVTLHFLSALLLFGIVRRLLDKSRLRAAGAVQNAPGSQGACEEEPASWAALCVALLWAVHPLQTGAVTYVVQRAEALSGFFYLAAFYAFLRTVAADDPPRKDPGPIGSAAFWAAVSMVACFLGVATKETVATAPVLALLCDRCFYAGSFREAWRLRRRLYLGLAASWLLLALLILGNPGRGGSVGWSASVTPWDYLLTQCEALVRYLGLSIWPTGQVFDYGAFVVAGPEAVLLQALLLIVLAGASLWALLRKHPAGFAGAAFFLLLAPSSSFVPVATQTMAEHRMYLALAVVLAFLVALVASLSASRGRAAARASLAAAAIAAVALLGLTRLRNQVYADDLSLWRDTVEKWPGNPRALNNLGNALLSRGRYDEAAVFFRRAIKERENHAFAYANLGVALMQSAVSAADRGARLAEAEGAFRRAAALDARDVASRINLGKLLAERGARDEARSCYEAALALEPGAQDARVNLAALALSEGRTAESAALLRKALAERPELAEARLQLGFLLEKQGAQREAEAEFRHALRNKPELAGAQLALGKLLARGNDPEAETHLREALRLDPGSAESWYALGTFFVRRERLAEAVDAYEQALRRDPGHAQALNNLGNCYLVSGRIREAADCYEKVLRLRPGDASVRQNLEYARELLGKGP